MTKITRFAMGLAAFTMLLGMGALTGCASSTENRLWAQNTELQDKVARTTEELIISERERARLQAELEQARAEREAAARQPAPQPALPGLHDSPTAAGLRPAGGDFESISEVQTVRAGSSVTVSVPGDILFAPGQATLTDASRRTLARVSQVLNNRYPRGVIRIVGHTDSDPIRRSRWGSNQELSVARAAAVRDYLATQGVSTARMVVSGMGADQPVAPNTTAANKAKNRRVEIVVEAQ